MRRALAHDRLEEPCHGRHDPHISHDRLHDDRGDLGPPSREERTQRIDVVIRKREGVRDRRRRNAGRVGHAERRRAAPSLDEQEVRVPVIATLEFHDRVAARETARDAQRAHRRLGAAADGAHHLDRRVERAQLFGEANLELRRRSVARATPRGVADSLDHRRMRVSEDHGPP